MNYLTEIAERVKAAVPPEDVLEDAEDLFILYALLVELTGESTTTEDVHNAWTAWMLLRGEQHPSMVRFSDLPPDVQAEDAPFAQAIRSVAAKWKGHGE